MADSLKRHLDRARVVRIAAELARAWPAFPAERFVADAVAGLDALELLDRGRHIAAALARALPAHFPAAVDVLLAALLPSPAPGREPAGDAFHLLPHTQYVAAYGLDHPEDALRAQLELTQRFTCEFAIRPYLERHPDRTLARLHAWTRHPSEHVRRLVSEGTRPRLPWAPRLRAFVADPSPILPLLEALRDDPSAYVRRSVANNLNDIAKDHPALVADLCARWLDGASPERRWVVARALRAAVKRGDAAALATLGAGAPAEVRVTGRVVPDPVRAGGDARFDLLVENVGAAAIDVVVDLLVRFPGVRGGGRAKVFKLRRVTIAPGAAVPLRKTITFRPLSTRRVVAGAHTFAARVNGRDVEVGGFVVVV